VAYEKIKLKDGKDVEVQTNLGFIYFHWHSPSNPTTLWKWALMVFWRVCRSGLAARCPKGFSLRIVTWYSARLWGCVGLLWKFPLTNKTWSWKVKESKFL
jgi:hypothetical protein